MVKNVMKAIKNLRVNERYDAGTENFQEIFERSKNSYDVVENSFNFGYLQGYKAAQAELKRKGKTA